MTPMPSSDDLFPFQGEKTMQEWFVTPGKSTYIPVRLSNPETTTKILHLSIAGIPPQWLETIPQKVVVSPGEDKEIALIVQPPDVPATQMGRYPLRVTVTQEDDGRDQVVLEGGLIVAAYAVQGRIAILMEALQYTVAPGDSIHVQFKLINQGLDEDTFRFAIEGIPASWISTTTPAIRLKPGEQKTIAFTIHATRHPQSRAGRHPFKINIQSQLNPAETASVDCVLTVEAYSAFDSFLKPDRISTGDKVQVIIQNEGNIPDSYIISWASTHANLGFDWVGDYLSENNPSLDERGIVRVRLGPGETGALYFQPKLHTGPNLLGNLVIPYKVAIEPADGNVQTHTGEVSSEGLIPVWIVQVGIMLLLALMCLASFFFFRGNLVASQATETALAAIMGATQTVAAAPTQTAAVTQTAAAHMTQAAEAGQQDADGDGLTNAQETDLGTDPLLADTDNDGLFDGIEIQGATDPSKADTDADGLPDGDEVQRGTNPLAPDTDTDGLPDGQEVQLGTDPLAADSDADGLLDGNETPPCPNPLNPDSDGDGLIDRQDLEPCDPNNPFLTATAIAAIPTATPPQATPTAEPTQASTVPPSGTPAPEPTATPEPPIPPLEGMMAFVSTRDGNPEIYTLNLVDNALTRLTTDPAVEAQPSWSPDGDQIVFSTNRDGNFEVYVMNADGTDVVNLTQHSSDDFDPVWSPDGTQIAFVSNREGNNEIYVMNADGTDPFNATNNPANDSEPAWFVQDGIFSTVRIAFTSDRDGNKEVYSMNPGGTGQTNLTNHPAQDYAPAGRAALGFIAFTTDRDGNEEVYVMENDGSSPTNLTNQPSAADWSPAWGADEEWVAFVSNRDGNQEIYVVNTGEQVNLTANPGDDYDPGWYLP